MWRKWAHKFTLKAGVGEPFDADTVTDLYRRILCILSNSDNFTNAFVATDEGTRKKSAGANSR